MNLEPTDTKVIYVDSWLKNKYNNSNDVETELNELYLIIPLYPEFSLEGQLEDYFKITDGMLIDFVAIEFEDEEYEKIYPHSFLAISWFLLILLF